MSVMRGDVVILDFPQAPGQPSKRRPAVVVQCDLNNGRLSNSIFAVVTSNTRLATTEACQVLIDIATADGQQTGLSRTSAVKCENLHTLPQSAILKTIGQLAPVLLQQIDGALSASLGLP